MSYKVSFYPHVSHSLLFDLSTDFMKKRHLQDALSGSGLMVCLDLWLPFNENQCLSVHQLIHHQYTRASSSQYDAFTITVRVHLSTKQFQCCAFEMFMIACSVLRFDNRGQHRPVSGRLPSRDVERLQIHSKQNTYLTDLFRVTSHIY